MGWLYCPPLASSIIADTFYVFKTPLGIGYDHLMEEQFQFHPQEVFQSTFSVDLKIGLWIDLTSSENYSELIITRRSCEYLKLETRHRTTTRA